MLPDNLSVVFEHGSRWFTDALNIVPICLIYARGNFLRVGARRWLN